MENKNICLQCEQKDITLESGVCPHCNYLNRKNDYLQNDGNITITKDNIHLYYEFMSDTESKEYSYLLQKILHSRCKNILRNLYLIDTSTPSWQKEFEKFKQKEFYYVGGRGHYFIYKSFIFGVKDILKPIDEYIEDIKASSEYKEYNKIKQ